MSIPKVTPFDAYKSYLGLKNHFTKAKYDYHKYCGKSRASLQSFYKRRDRFWFEKLSRQKDDKEVVDFFVANFVSCVDPQTLWIGEMIKTGETNFTDWKKKIQSLSYPNLKRKHSSMERILIPYFLLKEQNILI